VPWPVVEGVCRLDLPRPSLWRVYLAVLLTSQRYGGGEARLMTREIASMTALSPRTVERALADLQAIGAICRVGRRGRLMVTGTATTVAVPRPLRTATTVAVPEGSTEQTRPATVLTAPNRHRAGGSPTVFRFSNLEQVSNGADGVFSLRQQRVILDVMAEATELAGESAWDMELAPEAARLLGFGAPTTFRQAVAILTDRRDKTRARGFVKAVLRLRYDARIQGEEVPHVGDADHLR
jgi:hypothetical protein